MNILDTLDKLMDIFDGIGPNAIDNYFYNLDEIFTLTELFDSYIEKYDSNLVDIFDLILEYLEYQLNDVEFNLNKGTYEILDEKIEAKSIKKFIEELLYILINEQDLDFKNDIKNVILKHNKIIKKYLRKKAKNYIFEYLVNHPSEIDEFFKKFNIKVSEFYDYFDKDDSKFTNFFESMIKLEGINLIKNKTIIKNLFKEILKSNDCMNTYLATIAVKNKYLFDIYINSDCIFEDGSNYQSTEVFWTIMYYGDEEIFEKMIDKVKPSFFKELNIEEYRNSTAIHKFIVFVDILLSYKCDEFFDVLEFFIEENEIENDCVASKMVENLFEI
jgi:hypothetical protein